MRQKYLEEADDHVSFLVTIESLLMIIPTAEYIFITCRSYMHENIELTAEC